MYIRAQWAREELLREREREERGREREMLPRRMASKDKRPPTLEPTAMSSVMLTEIDLACMYLYILVLYACMYVCMYVYIYGNRPRVCSSRVIHQ